MLHSGRQECFLFLPWIKDSFSEDFDFDLRGQLSRSTQELFNLTSTVTLPLRSTWFGPWRLWFAFRWRRPDSSFVVWYCCPYGSYAAILNSQKTFDAEIATLSLDLRYKAWQGLKVSSHQGDVQKSVLKEWVQRFPWWRKWNDGLHAILWQAQSYNKPELWSYKLMILLFSLWRVLMVTPIVKGSSYCGA